MKKILTLTTKILKRALITFSILLFLFFLTVSVKFYNSSDSKKRLYKTISKAHWKNLEALPTEVATLGPHGATIFKNLFLHENQYLLAQNEDQHPHDPKSILNEHGTYHYKFVASTIESIKDKQSSLKRSKMLPGTTLILSSSNEMKSMQAHYFHFCEEFLLGWSAHKASGAPPIQTIVFPDIDNWQGRINDISATIIYSVLPNVHVINASEFKSLSKKYLLQFENAVFIDRHACHLNEEVCKFNKMIIAHKPYIKKEYVREIRDSLLTSLRTYDNPTSKPYITYIMRKSYRYLEPECEKELLSQIAERFPEYRLNPVWFENYTFPEQLQIIRNTKVLIGAHGNGLTHQLFLPTDSLVIEIFPTGAYANDYHLFSDLSHHTYFGVDPKNGVISKNGTLMPVRGNVNQVITEFDPALVTDLIHDFTSKGEEEASEETLKEISLTE